MKKGELINKTIGSLESRSKYDKIKDRFLVVLACAFSECEQEFHKLDGLTFPNGHGILISRSKQQIENSMSSAIAEAIPQTPYFAEIGQSKKALKQIIEMALVELGYPPGLRNDVKRFLEPQTTEEKFWKYKDAL